MKLYTDVQQGSGDWYRLRLGRATASNFHLIVTPKKCELSKSASKYALRLVAERLLNMPTDAIEGVAWMERGKEFEPMAVKQYEFTTEEKTIEVGFITSDDGSLGCSPDRIVVRPDLKVGLEIKCPSPHVHLGYLLNGTDDDYKPQVQGQILVAELDYADFYSFHPRMPPRLIRTEPDGEYIEKLSTALKTFNELLDNLTERARKLGAFQAFEKLTTPAEMRDAQESDRALEGETVERFARQGFEA